MKIIKLFFRFVSSEILIQNFVIERRRINLKLAYDGKKKITNKCNVICCAPFLEYFNKILISMCRRNARVANFITRNFNASIISS